VEPVKTDEAQELEQEYVEYVKGLPKFENNHYQQFLSKADQARAKDLS